MDDKQKDTAFPTAWCPGLTKLEYAAVHIMAAHCNMPAFADTPTKTLATYSVEAARALFAELEKGE